MFQIKKIEHIISYNYQKNFLNGPSLTIMLRFLCLGAISMIWTVGFTDIKGWAATTFQDLDELYSVSSELESDVSFSFN